MYRPSTGDVQKALTMSLRPLWWIVLRGLIVRSPRESIHKTNIVDLVSDQCFLEFQESLLVSVLCCVGNLELYVICLLSPTSGRMNVHFFLSKTTPRNLNWSINVLQLKFCCAHVFWFRSNTEVVNTEVVINSRIETLCNVDFQIE